MVDYPMDSREQILSVVFQRHSSGREVGATLIHCFGGRGSPRS
jgi:hypothetical protein